MGRFTAILACIKFSIVWHYGKYFVYNCIVYICVYVLLVVASAECRGHALCTAV